MDLDLARAGALSNTVLVAAEVPDTISKVFVSQGFAGEHEMEKD